MIERIEFYERYKMTPQHFEKRFKLQGEFEKNGHRLSIVGVEKDKTGAETLLKFTDNGVEEIIDLAPHWERGSDEPIHCTREGAMNLVRAVYAQTEKDLEELYTGGELALRLERNVGESYDKFLNRIHETYRKEIKRCENFLGPVLSRYTKIKAYYVRRKMTVNEIADIMGETPRHVACVVERLGLNRSETFRDSTVEYVDE